MSRKMGNTASNSSLVLNCRQRGIAAVETTFVLPLLFMLILAIAEFGRLFYQLHSLNNLQRSAARYLSIELSPGESFTVDLSSEQALETLAVAKKIMLQGTTDQESTADTMLPGLVASDIQFSAPSGNNEVVVTTNYTYEPIFSGIIPEFYGEKIDLSFRLPASMAVRVLD